MSWQGTSSSCRTIGLGIKSASLVRGCHVPRFVKAKRENDVPELLTRGMVDDSESGFSRGAYTARALAGLLHKVSPPLKDRTQKHKS